MSIVPSSADLGLVDGVSGNTRWVQHTGRCRQTDRRREHKRCRWQLARSCWARHFRDSSRVLGVTFVANRPASSERKECMRCNKRIYRCRYHSVPECNDRLRIHMNTNGTIFPVRSGKLYLVNVTRYENDYVQAGTIR